MSSNIDAFIAETNREIKKLQEKQVSMAKQIVLGAYSQILDRSPVDTGLFKHNNFLTVNSKTNKVTGDEFDSSMKAVIDGGFENIEKAKFNHGMTLTIQNSLSYADALESGHSSQASAGVYGITERLVARQLAKRTKI